MGPGVASASRFGSPQAAWLAALGLALALLATAPTAEAQRKLYVGGVFGPGVASLDIGSGGALSSVAGSPFGTHNTDGLALTPDGRHLYAAEAGTGEIHSYDVRADGGLTALPPLELEPPPADPTGIAISPDGRFAYVADPEPEAVRVFAIGAGGALTPAGLTPLGGAESTRGIAITPNGDYLYATVGNPPAAVYGFAIGADGSLTHLAPFSVPAIAGAESISVTPDGRHLYVGSPFGTGVQGFAIGADGSLAPVPGSPFAAGVNHTGLAVSPSGDRLFVSDGGPPDAVESFAIGADGSLAAVAESPFAASDAVAGIAVTPSGKFVYASADIDEGNVSAFSVAPTGALSLLSGSPFASEVKLPIFATLAVSPNQAPTASFGSAQARRSNRVDFDAGSSGDSDGAVARFDWEFGDGTTLPNGGPRPSHVYARPGTYAATLTVTDAEGCATTFVFTGQTASCNGLPTARTQRSVRVVDNRPPRLRLFGPKRQRLGAKVLLRASCDERCTATARGSLVLGRPGAGASAARRLKLKPVRKTLDAGRRGTLKLKLSGKAKRAAGAVLASGGTVRAKLVARAGDAAGNRSSRVRRTIGLTLSRAR